VNYSLSRTDFLIFFPNLYLESLPSVVFTHHLSKLVNLQLNGNRIYVLPASFSHLTALKELHLSNNRFFTIPRAVLHLTNLQYLDLSFNRITKIKDEIELLEVDELNLNNNQVSVRGVKAQLLLLSCVFCYNDRINVFLLFLFQINQISVNISKCKRLKILRLNNNNLNLKSIPTSLLRDSIVCQLSVKGNCFEDKQFVLVEGYDDYERRYTRNQRKKD
jgi:Leucine-rich repeat (LRR) protein